MTKLSTRTTLRSVTIALLVGAYLSAWSAVLVQTLILPALGSGPSSVSSPDHPTKERPAIVLTQQRHMPLVKLLTIESPPPAPLDYPRPFPWAGSVLTPGAASLLAPPLLAPHPGRAPPFC
jgi:hypothetical protein